MKLFNLICFFVLLKVAMAIKVCSVELEIDNNQYLNAVGRGYTISQCESRLADLSRTLNSLKVKKVLAKSQVNCEGYHCVLKTSTSYKCDVVKAVRESGFDIPSTFSLCD
ncbi:hypothetical protein G6F16_007239 [Rhizopus arrhizus]|nr:hypothetical protein G6F20_006868 [Rhizopus arrhizus]KAG0837438.1 hypothetical protein G6F19_003704 [Rhizopus arrhizus]KAG0869540.1 hypothetical protein G6F16_007239 [Rhizopus arrhizus]KAG0888628.1 hypothetical protein G6F15_001401 [Rhizopus arrhizus]KAG0898723.1 hypothetical protein G6F34_005356 [Rhizopus arrhizus]